MQINKEFTNELDNITQKQWKDVFSKIKDVDNIVGIKLLINPKDVLNLLEKYDLDQNISFILDNTSGSGKILNHYNGYPIEPSGRYLGVKRNVNLFEILTECTLQKTYKPDISHLQI